MKIRSSVRLDHDIHPLKQTSVHVVKGDLMAVRSVELCAKIQDNLQETM